MFKSPPIEKIHPFHDWFSPPPVPRCSSPHRVHCPVSTQKTTWRTSRGHKMAVRPWSQCNQERSSQKFVQLSERDTQSCVHPLDAPRVPSNPFVELETNQGPHHRWETLGCEFPSNDGKKRTLLARWVRSESPTTSSRKQSSRFHEPSNRAVTLAQKALHATRTLSWLNCKSLNVEQTYERTERPVATLNTVEAQDRNETFNKNGKIRCWWWRKSWIKDVNEADMDFRIPGLPHSVVKHAQNTSVRQLIQKIENHPNRHAIQRDLQQSQSFNPVNLESKQMIRDVGNIEFCEFLETEPKTQCTMCLSYWNIGILYCTCGHFLRKGTGE